MGSLKLVGKEWVVEADPHVTMMLRRVFPRVQKGQHGTIRLTSTDEVCRNLVWFLDRFALDLSEEDRFLLRAKADAHRSRERQVATLDEPAEPEIDDGPFVLCPQSVADLAEGSISARIVKFLRDNPDRAWSVRQVATGLLISDREAVSFALTDLYHARFVERRRGRGCFQYRLVQSGPVQEEATV